MGDTISTYRTVRLIIQPGRIQTDRSYWCVHAVRVTRGIPHTVVLLDGSVPLLRQDCTTEEIIGAIAAIADQSML